VTETHSFILDE